jgi:hypothetical protein
MKGRSHFLLRHPLKRAKLDEEVEEIKKQKEEAEQEKEMLLAKIEEMQKQMTEYENIQDDYIESKQRLKVLEEKGVINEKGEERIKF